MIQYHSVGWLITAEVYSLTLLEASDKEIEVPSSLQRLQGKPFLVSSSLWSPQALLDV